MVIYMEDQEIRENIWGQMRGSTLTREGGGVTMRAIGVACRYDIMVSRYHFIEEANYRGFV